MFDLARYLFGEVEEVYCKSNLVISLNKRESGIDDVGITTLSFQGGLIGVISNTFLAVKNEIWMRIISESGDFFLNTIDSEPKKLIITRREHTQIFEEEEVPNPGVKLENETFINAVKKGDCSGIKSDYADAVQTLRVTLAAEESASCGKPVKVPKSRPKG